MWLDKVSENWSSSAFYSYKIEVKRGQGRPKKPCLKDIKCRMKTGNLLRYEGRCFGSKGVVTITSHTVKESFLTSFVRWYKTFYTLITSLVRDDTEAVGVSCQLAETVLLQMLYCLSQPLTPGQSTPPLQIFMLSVFFIYLLSQDSHFIYILIFF